ncbi:hypothetical protein PF005_g24972 [Phytophthora fragariae]|uniref:FLYWCH-type domain-containing protein n=1 Tax=Phytophthora fragariae TaxID=53985 RepID=A0A6A3QMQ6_9STRA|nr:hypothetical protein PF009_g26237 [Phytophthora fragariae]KAE8969959.1 hypothetical protein PF011_g26600 [Phytophthora fragariae]KAE9075531.1 hypothetical protein PF007_g24970 [Phytophthora fragariae]KAE9078880.1 hypothetical protein PF006_g27625 [Phytophthora fragariae]KAE9174504.1 hypothetical protein PF004_g26643 [Phytophthora fragariae]
MSARKVVDQSAAVQDSRFTTTIYLEGYQYTRATTSARKTSYRCSYYRSAGCKGKVDLIARTKTFTNFTDHTCERGDHLASETSDLTNSVTPDTVTTGHPYMVPTQGGFQPPPVNRVARAGPGQIDPNDLARIESPPLLFVRNSTLNFFQFNCMSGYGPDNTPNRVIGWAHPHLVELLKHAGSTIYVDTSCRHLPPGFGQCLALVVYNKPSGFFVPVYYVLCTLRTVRAYRNAISFIVGSTRRKLKPDEVVCDFDGDLMSALQAEFPNAVVKGAVHLFKKTCRSQMERLEISEEAANIAMQKGVLDMLVSIPPDRVATAGIAWVKQQIKAKCAGAGMPYAQEQWRSFWVYFRRIWITQFPPALWNLHGLSNSIIARTSNPLEQFHRELDAAFTSQDPGLLFFVATVEKMARHHVADLAAETTTLPSAVEVFSEGEASSDEESIGDESDGDDDDDNVESFKCEPPLGRQSSVGNRDETATSLTKRST